MLRPSTQYKLCVLQGLAVEQPIQFCPLYQSVAVTMVYRSPCMDFLPPSGGVFRLALARSSPDIPCRRSFGFQGAMLERQQKSCHKTDRSYLRFFRKVLPVGYVAT